MNRTQAISFLPSPLFRNTLNFNSGQNQNIIDVIHANFAEATKQTKSLSNRFRGKNDTETASNIWHFLKNNIQYVKDIPGRQDVKLPSRFVYEGSGDCKSYSLFTAGILQNLNIPFKFRYTSYSSIDRTPQHVYIVLDNGIIIDAVYTDFNKEKKFTFKKDYKMRISTLSGIGCNGNCHAQNINGVSNPVVMIGELDGIGKISLKKVGQSIKKVASKVQDKAKGTKVVKAAAKAQTQVKNTKVVKAAAKAQTQVKKTAKNVAQTIVRAGKSVVGAAPRRAYRTLVALNFRGWANKLNSNKNEAHRIWKNAGGIFEELEKSISAGVKRKPLFGAKKTQKVSQVSGIGEPVTLATVGAILAAAAPLIILFKNLTGDSPNDAGVDPNATSSDGVNYDSEAGSGNVLTDIVDNVSKIFTGNQYNERQQKTDETPSQDQATGDGEKGTSNTAKTLLTVAAIGTGLYFLTKK
jgi:hypothetical protein